MRARVDAVAAVRAALDGRELVWFGTRGDDIEAVADLPELVAAYSVIGAYRRRTTIESLAFEDIVGRRVDLDAHDIDDELTTDRIAPLRRAILNRLSSRSAILTYRPSTFVSSIYFARRDRSRYLGMFKDHQNAFEHKPWVETSVRDLGIPSIPWTYIADEEQLELVGRLATGSLMLRRSHSSGGTGLHRVESQAELLAAWPRQREEFVSVAPFLDGGLPVNVGGVVWADGGVTLHPASVQLIGIPELVARPFGYCGNDFGTFARLDSAVIEQIDKSTRRVGAWLAVNGYRGAYGVDFLVVGGTPLFTEVNPRFQGSTHLSAKLAVDADAPCIILDHLAAFLGLPTPKSTSLRTWAEVLPTASHLVAHRVGHDEHVDPVHLVAALTSDVGIQRTDVACEAGVALDPNATVVRLTLGRSVTDDGFHADDAVVRAISAATACATVRPQMQEAGREQ